MTDLKSLRLQKKLTQKEAANMIGVSLRSYISFENDESKVGTPKYRFLISELDRLTKLDEEHGILSLEDIRAISENIFQSYPVKYCFLFGSYAKGQATESSDVDLLISTPITGLQFYDLAERLREQLHKRVDLLDTKQLLNNIELLDEILKDGVKIYG